MPREDFSADLVRVSRTWNAIKTQGEAAMAANATLALIAGRWNADAGRLSSGAVYSPETVRRDLSSRAERLRVYLRRVDGVMLARVGISSALRAEGASVNSAAWVTAAPIYGDQISALSGITTGWVDAVVGYGSDLSDAGVTAPAKVVTDVARVASKNVRSVGVGVRGVISDVGDGAAQVVSGAGDAVANLGGAVTDAVGKSFWSLLPILAIAAVGVYVLRKPLSRALHA